MDEGAKKFPIVTKVEKSLFYKSLETFGTAIAQNSKVYRVKKDQIVGYEGTWKAKRNSVIGILPIGYADGYPYSSQSREVSINGKKFKTAGKINMDLITINLEQDSSIKIGDWVELWGFDTNLTSFSQELDSISYQLLTNISGRVNKNYLE